MLFVGDKKLCANNVLGVILSISNDVFSNVGIINRILPLLYVRNQIFVCEKQLISNKDVPYYEIPLRTVGIENLLTGGRRFIFCFYKTKFTTIYKYKGCYYLNVFYVQVIKYM